MHSHLRTLALLNALLVLSATPLVRAQGMTKGHPLEAFAPDLKTGDYVWHPEISPAGPVVVLISLSRQILYVYRNGIRIGRSTVSSGKEGHRTPTGVFTILEKQVRHVSTIFRGASMPYMERLTWGGVAMHGGNLPGYPASHACVRLPIEFARKLYSVTGLGTTVIVTDGESASGATSAPGLLFAATSQDGSSDGREVWEPEKAPKGPVSIIVSSADSTVCIYRNGVMIGRAGISGTKRFKGAHAYSALSVVDADGKRSWLPTMNVGGRAPNVGAIMKRSAVNPEFLARVRTLIIPGTTLILTDAPLSPNLRGAAECNILTAASLP